jgi:hypothetical protein
LGNRFLAAHGIDADQCPAQFPLGEQITAHSVNMMMSERSCSLLHVARRGSGNCGEE